MIAPPTQFSYLAIDNGMFNRQKNFSVEKQSITEGNIEIIQYGGTKSVYSRWKKETFKLTVNALSQAEKANLYNLYNRLGVNAFHTVAYQTLEMTVLYDGNSHGSPINTDRQGLSNTRNKVSMSGWTESSVDGAPDIFTVSIICKET